MDAASLALFSASLFAGEPIDVIIPCAKRDSVVLEECIRGVRRNLKDVGNVYIVSPEKLTNSATWIDEKTAFPFTKTSIADFLGLHHRHYRMGWYLQQLLKLYAPLVIEGLSEYYFILDSDTVFLNPTRFVDDDGKLLFNISHEYHPPYFEHMKRLLPALDRQIDRSGITNCMIFKQSIVRDLIWRVEHHHNTEFWKAFLSCVERKHFRLSGASEFEIFFNFCLKYYPDCVKIEPLHWGCSGELERMEIDRASGTRYMSYHWYLRRRQNRRERRIR